jgi:cytochrome P450
MFSPERLLEESGVYNKTQLNEMRLPFSPFSIVSRSCAGKPLAYLESRVTVAKALWYIDIEMPQTRRDENRILEMKDQQGSDHSGPDLHWTARGNHWQDLVGKTTE